MELIKGDDKPHRSWGESIRSFYNRKVITMLFLGFSAGVPILLIFSTLSAWLREADVTRGAIGFFSWAALGYGFKFIWAPIIDKLPLPGLTAAMGQRRSWLLVAQFAVIASIALMALTDPKEDLMFMALAAVALGFASATQDIVIDAYRIESADMDMQGLLSSTYVAGYRIGMVVAGAGALEIAGLIDVIDGYDYNAWRISYLAMAGVMLVGVATTFMIPEPEREDVHSVHLNSLTDYLRFLGLFVIFVATFIGMFFLCADLVSSAKASLIEGDMNKRLAGFLTGSARMLTSLGIAGFVAHIVVRTGIVPRQMFRETYLAPFIDLLERYGKVALLILALVATYRISDIVMGVMANVFYIDLGFEKQEIGRISKGFGLGMTIAGTFIGGLICVRYGVLRTLFLGAFLSAITNVLFSILAGLGHNIPALMLVISADNLSGGIATAAFIAWLSSLTSKSFTATQYAVFSSVMLLFPKLIGGYSGVMVESVGYSTFFIGTAVIGIVPLTLIVLLGRRTT